MTTVNRYQQDFDALLARYQLTADQLPGLVEAWNRKVQPVDDLLNQAAEITGHRLDENHVLAERIRPSFLYTDDGEHVNRDWINVDTLRRNADDTAHELAWRRDPSSRIPVLVIETTDPVQSSDQKPLASLLTDDTHIDLYRIPDEMIDPLVKTLMSDPSYQWMAHLKLMREGALGPWSLLGSTPKLIHPRLPHTKPVLTDWVETTQKLLDQIDGIDPEMQNAPIATLAALDRALAATDALLKRPSIEKEWSVHKLLTALRSELASVRASVKTYLDARNSLTEAQELIERQTALGLWLAGEDGLMTKLADLAESIDSDLDDTHLTRSDLLDRIAREREWFKDEQSRFQAYHDQWAAGWPETAGPLPTMPTQS